MSDEEVKKGKKTVFYCQPTNNIWKRAKSTVPGAESLTHLHTHKHTHTHTLSPSLSLSPSLLPSVKPLRIRSDALSTWGWELVSSSFLPFEGG